MFLLILFATIAVMHKGEAIIMHFLLEMESIKNLSVRPLARTTPTERIARASALAITTFSSDDCTSNSDASRQRCQWRRKNDCISS